MRSMLACWLALAGLLPAAWATTDFTITLDPDASVVQGNSSDFLTFTVTNTSTNNEELFEIVLTLPGTTVGFVELLSDPIGWDIQAYSPTEITLRPEGGGLLLAGESLDLTLEFAAADGFSEIPTASMDVTETFTSIRANFQGEDPVILTTTPPLPSFERRGLELDLIATNTSVGVGDTVTLTYSVTNRTDTTQTGILPTAPVVGGTATATLATGPTPASLTLAPDETAILVYTYTVDSTGTLTFTSQVSNGTASSPVRTSNEVIVGDFTAQLEVTPLLTTDGQQVTVQMNVCNNGGSSVGNVTPSALTFTGTATATLVSGPTPVKIASIKAGSCGTFTWVYTIEGDPQQSYQFSGSATGNGGAATGTATTSQGALGNVTLDVTPDSVATGATDVQLCFFLTNESGQRVDQMVFTIPAGFTGAVGEGSSTEDGVAWTVTGNGTSTVTMTAPNPSAGVNNGSSGTFCLTFTGVPSVGGDTSYPFPVQVIGPQVDILDTKDVLVTADKITLTHNPAGPLDADGTQSYEMCARLTRPQVTENFDTTASSAVVTATGATFVSNGIVAGDLLVIEDGLNAGTYVIQSVDSETQLTLTEALTATESARTATVERPRTGDLVAFTADQGSLSSNTATVGTTGLACVDLTGPPSTTDLSVNVQASFGSAVAADSVDFTGVPGPILLPVGSTLTPTTVSADTADQIICFEILNLGDTDVTLDLSLSTFTVLDTTGVSSVLTGITTPAPTIVAGGDPVEVCFQGYIEANHVNGNSNILTAEFHNVGDTFQQDVGVDDLLNIINGTLAQVSQFYADPDPQGGVVVRWITQGEDGTAGFHVERRLEPGGPWERLTTVPIPGAGTTDVAQVYAYRDTEAGPDDSYTYRVVEVEVDGDEIVHEAVASTRGAPADPAVTAEVLAGQAPPGAPGLRILEAGPSGYLVELSTPEFRTRRIRRRGWAFDILDVVGYPHARVGEVGKPELPVVGRYLPRPAGAVPVVLGVEVAPETYGGILPLPVFDSVAAQADGVTVFGTSFVRDEDFYSAPGVYPAAWAEVEDGGYAGSTPMFRLRIHPLRVRPSAEELLFGRTLRVRIGFAPGGSDLPPAPAPLDVAVAAARADTVAPLVKLEVSAPGLQRVALADLVAHTPGLASVPTANWRLLHAGAEVPMRVVDGAGGYLEFVGAPRASKWSAHDVYWLATDAAGTRVATAAPVSGTAPASVTATARRDEDGTWAYWAHVPGPDDYERWFLPGIALAGTPLAAHVTLPGLDSSGPAGSVSLRGASVTRTFGKPLQTLRLQVGGSDVDTHEASGLGLFDMAGTVAAGTWASPLPVQLAVDAAPDGSLRSYVADWAEVRYPRSLTVVDDAFRAELPAGTHAFEVTGFSSADVVAYDLTDPAAPIRLPVSVSGAGPYTADVSVALAAPAEVLVVAGGAAASPTLAADQAGDLPSPGRAIALLALAPADAGTALDDLLDRREGQGIASQRVDLEAVYDAWGDGRIDPVAVQRFLAGVHAGWPAPTPRALLLAGLASRDPKARTNAAMSDPVPLLCPTVFRYTNFMGETGSDLELATAWGADRLPDFRVGRIPARTPAQLATYVAKLIAYEDVPLGDAFEERFVVSADDGMERFRELANESVGHVPGPAAVTMARLGVDGDAAATRAALQAGWEAGSVLVDFTGHGGMSLWAAEDLLPMATTTSLVGAPRLPVVVSRACQDGYAHFPLSFFVSQSERLLFNANGGAVVAFTSAGTSGVRSKRRVLDAFLATYLREGTRVAGDATFAAALRAIAEGATDEDAVSTHVLLGDPTLRLHHPAPLPPRVVSRRRGHDGTEVVAWTPNVEIDLAAYRVYRGAVLLATLAPGVTSYVAPPPPPNALTVGGELAVVAVDSSGIESPRVTTLPLLATPDPSSSSFVGGGGGGGGGCAAGGAGGAPLAWPLLWVLGLVLARRRPMRRP
jgi:hypothetical protein